MTTRKPFSAHDLDIDNSGSPISRMLRGKTSRPPTEEEIVDRTRRERDEAQAKSRFMVASTLDTAVRWGLIFEWELLPSGNVCLIDNEGRRDLPPLDAVNALAEQWGKIARERDDLRNAARAVVVAKVRPCYICDKFSTVADLDDAFCEAHADLARIDKQDTDGAPAWRRLCALVKP